ncbi:MAG TPA: hypothetical protein VND96_07570 [Candidatus Micrarchaeaceae archaeon]|nr:hypothetical protein [Candidatus Micrarchaeaceae archaeon]
MTAAVLANNLWVLLSGLFVFMMTIAVGRLEVGDEFELTDRTRIGMLDEESDGEVLDETRQTLSSLKTSQQFIYAFDFGDDWVHLCTVVDANIDPLDALGLIPKAPLPFFGWGNIPDQYGRTWAEEGSENAVPADPELRDLAPLRPGWGADS